MNLFSDAIAWIFGGDPSVGDPIPIAIRDHLIYTAVAVGIAALVAFPAGWYIGHTGRGRDAAVRLVGAARAVPSFGLLILLVLVMGVLYKPQAAVLSYVLLAIPSLLAGAYAGVEAIDRRTIEAARALGMTPMQRWRRVELPLGLPLLVGGLRSATLQVVATVTIGAYVGLGGLGQYIIAGIPLRRFDMVLGGALLVTVLALVIDGLLALVQRAVTPPHARAARAARPAHTSRRRTPHGTDVPTRKAVVSATH